MAGRSRLAQHLLICLLQSAELPRKAVRAVRKVSTRHSPTCLRTSWLSPCAMRTWKAVPQEPTARNCADMRAPRLPDPAKPPVAFWQWHQSPWEQGRGAAPCCPTARPSTPHSRLGWLFSRTVPQESSNTSVSVLGPRFHTWVHMEPCPHYCLSVLSKTLLADVFSKLETYWLVCGADFFCLKASSTGHIYKHACQHGLYTRKLASQCSHHRRRVSHSLDLRSFSVTRTPPSSDELRLLIFRGRTGLSASRRDVLLSFSWPSDRRR